MRKTTVAVVGAGVAGIVTAHRLSQQGYDVTLFDQNDYIGGHTNTVIIDSGPDVGRAVDTGFIVLNDKTYPHFHHFLNELGVACRWSDMSFGYYDVNSGLQYAGTTLSGLFAQRLNIISPSFLSFLAEIRRFCVQGRNDLEQGRLRDLTLGSFLSRGQYSNDLIQHYVAPMGAAIWSTGLADILEFPAESFIRFFKNHGLLSLKDRPRWQTVVGGSHSYVKAFLSQFKGQVLRRAKVVQVQRKDGVIHIRIEGFADMRVFDRVVIAAHADEALAMLADPSSEESRLLGSWSYLRNRTLLHTDASFLPPNPRAGASWNYRREKGEDVHSGVSVTYDMNRLQGFSSHKRYLVTLNPRREPLPGSIVREFIYHHPAFDSKAIGAQKQLPSLNGIRSTWYCGSYFGNGFHEDAVVSAVAVARQFIAVQQEVA